jgi:hypothetical protein
MHALFHIRTVIIPRNWYRPEGFSPRFDTGRGMITVLIWKKSYITGNLFIIYFNIELKRIKLTSHTDTKLMDISNRYRLRDNSTDIWKHQQTFPRRTPTFSERQLRVERKWHHGPHERLDIVLSVVWDDITMALSVFTYGQNWRMGKIDVITYKYVINNNHSLTQIL